MLSQKQLEQRREAARARWRNHVAGAATGAAVAGAGAYAYRQAARGAVRNEVVAAAKQVKADIATAGERRDARIARVAELVADRKKTWSPWPVPARMKQLGRQAAVQQVKHDFHNERLPLADPTAQPGDFLYGMREDAGPHALDAYMADAKAKAARSDLKDLQDNAKPPKKGLRRASSFRFRSNFARKQRIGDMELTGAPKRLAEYESAVKEWENSPDKDWEEVPSPNQFNLKMRRKKVSVEVNPDTATVHTRVASKPRIQGYPDDKGLNFIRRKLSDQLDAVSQRAVRPIAPRFEQDVKNAKEAGQLSIRAALSRYPRWGGKRIAAIAGAGALVGAGLAAGYHEITKADTLRKSDSADPMADLARGLARTMKAWYDNPDQINPDDLTDATAPVLDAFNQGADIENDAISPLLEGRPRILAGTFGARNPRVEQAARQHQIQLVGELADTQQQAIQQAIIDHATRGGSPDTTAQSIRDVIGLTPVQGQHVARYRQELQTGDPGALRRALRDKRFDPSAQKAIDGQKLAPDKIDDMVDAYHKRYIAYRATTIARTESLRAANMGSIASTQSQLDAMPDMTVLKTWVATDDNRTRPDHRELNGKTVLGINTPFTTQSGKTIRYAHDPEADGSETINCRCTTTFKLVPKATAMTHLMNANDG